MPLLRAEPWIEPVGFSRSRCGRKGVSAFGVRRVGVRRMGEDVPEGLNDRSLAIYCQGKADNMIRPVGNGMKMFGTHGSHGNGNVV